MKLRVQIEDHPPYKTGLSLLAQTMVAQLLFLLHDLLALSHLSYPHSSVQHLAKYFIQSMDLCRTKYAVSVVTEVLLRRSHIILNFGGEAPTSIYSNIFSNTTLLHNLNNTE
jgi:hypothetical protein